MIRYPATRGMTLPELLVAIALIGVMAALGAAGMSAASAARDLGVCAARLRSAASGVLLFASDHAGAFPRSSHSSAAFREPGWMRSIAPYAGGPKPGDPVGWRAFLDGPLHCPRDPRPAQCSFVLNVYFELDPDYDDYPGSPAIWRTLPSVPRPSSTVLLAEGATRADHAMAHFWEGDSGGGEIAKRRHGSRAHYAFADGHVELLPFGATWEAPRVDRWCPAFAGSQ